MLQTKKQKNKTVVYPLGRLDVASSSQVEEMLLKLIDDGNLNLVLNLKNVEYMSSSGFRVCIAVLRRLKASGGSLKICCVRPNVSRVFDLIELDSLFDVYAKEEEALQA